MKLLEKICLWGIYAGAALSLTTPWWVDNTLFFPFITSKVLWFRIIVEVMLGLYLFLVFANPAYRPRRNWTLGLLALFIAWGALVSAVGHDFYFSFWSSMERGEGLILWLHGLAYFLILASVVRTERAWRALFDINLGAAVVVGLFALGQALHLSSILNTSGSRADATFGNAAFLAAYMLFQMAFAGYLFIVRPNKGLRALYAALFVFFGWVIVATETRGAILGFVGGLVVAALLFAWTQRRNRRVVQGSIALIVLVVAIGGTLFFSRNQPWVKNSPKLRRIVDVSLSDTTAQTRVATWGAAWKGWTESSRNFFLGVGLENFEDIFDKYFPPTIYQDAGSQVWYDRAHNVIFDRGTTTGVVGLLLYLAFLVYPVFVAVRRMGDDREKQARGIVFCGVAVAFVIQDLFVFESIATYVILFFAWAYLAAMLTPDDAPVPWPRPVALAAAVVFVAALGPLLWYVNIYPTEANRAATVAAGSDPQKEDFFTIVDRYKKAIEPATYGQREYLVDYIDFVGQQMASAGALSDQGKQVLAYTDGQLDTLLTKYPNYTKNYLVAMRHYNYTYAADPATEEQRLDQALTYFPKLQQMSPTRPLIWQEAGYTHLYLFRYFKTKGDTAQAQSHGQQAQQDFQKALDLNPQVVESYSNLYMLYLNTGDNQKIGPLIDSMRQNAPRWTRQQYLDQFINLAKNNKNLQWVNYFARVEAEQQPDNPSALIDVALSYAYLGDRADALATAERIKQFGGDFVAQADQFIQNVNSGYYEKNRPK